MSKILLVEDDATFADTISVWLRNEQHVVEWVGTGSEALECLSSKSYDVIIMDWNLPDTDGDSICRSFRSRGGQTPLLLLTGRGDDNSKEQGLDSGADDYLVKPPSLRELSARIRALLRRNSHEASDITIGGITIVPARKVLKDQQEVELTPKEYDLLHLLMMHRGVVISIEQIIERVWKSESEATAHAVRVCVNRLRQKVFESGAPSLKTIHGVGYMLE